MTWPDFWWDVSSNTIATIIGILVGVPAALFIERHRAAGEAKAAARERAARLRIAITMLDRSLEHNAVSTERCAGLLAKNEVPYDLLLDLATWESVRADIVELMRDAELQAHIGRHFERLHVLTQLHARILDLTIGIGSTIRGNETSRDNIVGTMRSITASVAASADHLRKELTRF